MQYHETNVKYELQAIGEAILMERDGGAEGDRTPDLVNAIHALSQLSYCPDEASQACGVSVT